MCQHLTEWRVVGLPYAALAAEMGDDCSVGAIAASLVRVIRLLLAGGGGGRYALAGYSVGAVIAAAAAAALEAEGEAVAALVLLDPPEILPAPAAGGAPPTAPPTARPAAILRSAAGRSRLRAMVEKHLAEVELSTADLPREGLVRAAISPICPHLA